MKRGYHIEDNSIEQKTKLLAEQLDNDKLVCLLFSIFAGSFSFSLDNWIFEQHSLCCLERVVAVYSEDLAVAGGRPVASLFVQKITFCLVESFLLKKPT